MGAADDLVLIQEFIGREQTPALIEGTLTRRGSAQIVAASGSGKTFVVLHLAWHLASSQLSEWFGRTIHDHGPVIYFPTEGLDTIGERSAALQAEYGDPDHPIIVAENSGPYPLASGLIEPVQQMIDRVAEMTGGVAPVALIVDTQLGVFASAGIDENDNGTMHAALDRLGDVCGPAGLNCLLLLVHHTGHAGDGSAGRVGAARGASSQFGFMDAVIELQNMAPTQLGKGPYYIRPTKFKPGVPWETKEEFVFVKVEGVGSRIEHKPDAVRSDGLAVDDYRSPLDDAIVEWLATRPDRRAKLAEIVDMVESDGDYADREAAENAVKNAIRFRLTKFRNVARTGHGVYTLNPRPNLKV